MKIDEFKEGVFYTFSYKLLRHREIFVRAVLIHKDNDNLIFYNLTSRKHLFCTIDDLYTISEAFMVITLYVMEVKHIAYSYKLLCQVTSGNTLNRVLVMLNVTTKEVVTDYDLIEEVFDIIKFKHKLGVL